jgi:hypothetical protein
MRRSRLPLISPGTVVRRFTEVETSALAVNWLAVFAKELHGINAEAYLWHVFSAARYPSVTGADAFQQYMQQSGSEFVVLSNDRKQAFLTELLPEGSSLADYYVFPPNLAWTMAFTHEDGWLGPYFACHPEYKRLNAENQARLQKRREAESARKRGWA